MSSSSRRRSSRCSVLLSMTASPFPFPMFEAAGSFGSSSPEATRSVYTLAWMSVTDVYQLSSHHARRCNNLPSVTFGGCGPTCRQLMNSTSSVLCVCTVARVFSTICTPTHHKGWLNQPVL